MSEPRVVIIIPSYNGVDVAYKGQPVLKHCLGSLKKTAYKNYAILVSDDCSTDSSVEGMAGSNLTYPNGKTQGNVIHFKDRFSLRTLGKSEAGPHEYKAGRRAPSPGPYRS